MRGGAAMAASKNPSFLAAAGEGVTAGTDALTARRTASLEAKKVAAAIRQGDESNAIKKEYNENLLQIAGSKLGLTANQQVEAYENWLLSAEARAIPDRVRLRVERERGIWGNLTSYDVTPEEVSGEVELEKRMAFRKFLQKAIAGRPADASGLASLEASPMSGGVPVPPASAFGVTKVQNP